MPKTNQTAQIRPLLMLQALPPGVQLSNTALLRGIWLLQTSSGLRTIWTVQPSVFWSWLVQYQKAISSVYHSTQSLEDFWLHSPVAWLGVLISAKSLRPGEPLLCLQPSLFGTDITVSFQMGGENHSVMAPYLTRQSGRPFFGVLVDPPDSLYLFDQND